MKMQSNYLKIQSDPGSLKIQIEKDSEFNFFHIFMLSIMTIGHVIIGLFILNSIRNDGILGMIIPQKTGQ